MLLRLRVAEAERFPVLVAEVGHARDVQSLAEVIAGTKASSARIERALVLASKLHELVIVPLQMRALLGEDREVLLRGAARRITVALSMLSATAMLDDWT